MVGQTSDEREALRKELDELSAQIGRVEQLVKRIVDLLNVRDP